MLQAREQYGVDIGTAVERQRGALLRLLAGWLAALFLLSAVPVSSGWDRSLRAFLFSVLWRAELAARCLLHVQARLHAGQGGAFVRLRFGPPPLTKPNPDEPPSLAELRARFLALRCLLKNLPRRAEALLRRMDRRQGLSGASVAEPIAPRGPRLIADQCAPVLPWHPPERAAPSD